MEFTRNRDRLPLVRIVFGLLALLATASATTSVRAQVSEEVYPKELQGAKPFELGELVLLLMPNSGTTSIGWDFRVDSPILWRTLGYESVQGRGGASLYIRNGIARVHIQGKRSTVLRQRVAELAWGLTYSSTVNPNLGPEEIKIAPGLPREGCFGAKYTGCDFVEPLNSLSQAGIVATKICGKRGVDELVSAFSLTHSGRRPTVMVWKSSGGSGGSSAEVLLKLNETPDPGMCDKL